LLDGARLKLRELKAPFTLLGAYTTYPLLRSDLEVLAIEIKDLKHRLDHTSRYSVLTPPCVVCGSLKGKFFHPTKENTERKQDVAYLTARLEKTILSQKIIEDDLSRVKESATKSTYKLCVGFERCEKKVRRVLLSLFLAPTITKKRNHSNQPKPTTHPIQRHPSNPREM
jgi:hypothetical protein